ncbi:MAG: VWA domain-containing protein [Flavobacteriales bacterium]|nr:VWA domain-containing protein [Flavobacteriales bacterium]MCX7768489.1 VWA domain-containing protein [Flavobacteriales bacterium]MDW8409822.1 VWA domain-containing protein [Flavobacteriales bacterium]
MSFERPELLYLLWTVPALLIAAWFSRIRHKRLIHAWVESSLLTHNLPRLSFFKPFLSRLMMILAYVGAVLTAAGPRWGNQEKKEAVQAHDIIVALDVSKSMLAEDLKPNRLERAKLSLKNLIRRRKHDRFGIVVFAGSAAVQLPLTTDKAAADLLTDKISTESVATGGTHISAALERSLLAFGEPGPANRALILISDGEDHEPGALEKARELAQNNIRIFTIGIGNSEGVPIPIYVNGQFKGYKTDADGRTVVTRLNEDLLRQLADIGGGIYVHGNDLSHALDQITAEIDRLAAEEIQMNRFQDKSNRFYYFAGFTVFLLLTEFFLPLTKHIKKGKTTLFD